ncbi:MAG: phosphopantetheine adenylyltransferase [Xanthomonadales bacterium]|nr:phosphopantetheine adenylyltransferase [Xanthomonadales bacterium]
MIAERCVQLVLLVAAIIHLAPISGLAGAEALQRLYGVDLTDPSTLMLMRHRAVLFALVGLPLVIGLFLPAWRVPALCGAVISLSAFLGLATTLPALNPALLRAVQIDIGLILLILPALGWCLRMGQAPG